MKLRLVALDVDGTLLDSAGVIRPESKAELDRVKRAGVRVLLASGRPVAGLRHQATTMGFDLAGMAFIGFNGAVVADAVTEEVSYQEVLDPDLVRRFIEHSRKFPVGLMITRGHQVLTEGKAPYMAEYESRSNGLSLNVVDDLIAALDVPVNKIMVSAEEAILQPLAEELAGPFRDEAEIAFSAPFYLEVTVRGADKGAALRHYCELEGFTRGEVIAFGDNHNDLPLLAEAGVAVAMGNAVDAVKQAADIVTGTNDSDGIAQVLRSHLPS